jgi:hypothetical protein
MINRDQARAERHPEKKARAAVFRYVPPSKDFKLTLRFRKNHVPRQEMIQALKRAIELLEAEERD